MTTEHKIWSKNTILIYKYDYYQVLLEVTCAISSREYGYKFLKNINFILQIQKLKTLIFDVLWQQV